jgi:hypothetical protein
MRAENGKDIFLGSRRRRRKKRGSIAPKRSMKK